MANAGAILVGHSGSRKLDVLDQDVVALHDPNRFAFRAFACCDQTRTAAFGADGQVALPPGRDIHHVIPGLDRDHIAIPRDFGRFSDARK